MPLGRSSTLLSLLRASNARVKYAVEIDLTSPLRYCTGENSVSVGGDTYTPWGPGFRLDPVPLDAPSAASCTIYWADPEYSLVASFDAEEPSGLTVTVYVLLQDSDGSWVTEIELPWKCTEWESDQHACEIRMPLTAAGGFRAKPLFIRADRSMPFFRHAPEGGESWPYSNGTRGVKVSNGPLFWSAPGGYDAPYVPEFSPVTPAVTDGDGGSSGGGGGGGTGGGDTGSDVGGGDTAVG